VQVAIAKKWVAGLKLFLNANYTQLFFTSLEVDTQKQMVSEVVKSISESLDASTIKNLATALLEDVLSKRPYVRSTTWILLD